jgi:hypothetical protein
MQTNVYDQLHASFFANGTRLFTVTLQDEQQNLTRRAYTSHPVEYPVQGTKPLTRDGWYEHCITAQNTFVANTTPEFAKFFFDHALITSLGLGSCINIPVIHAKHVIGTLNLLAEKGHFTQTKLDTYQNIVRLNHAALTQQMTQT